MTYCVSGGTLNLTCSLCMYMRCMTDPAGSPKQKEYKAPGGSGASPPSQTSRDKVSTAGSGSQAATWKDKVNPFKRHGSGSALSSADQAASSSSSSAASVVTGAVGVPLQLCQPGTANKVGCLDSRDDNMLECFFYITVFTGFFAFTLNARLASYCF